MSRFNCPSCAAPIDFKSSISVYAVCKYCNSMVVRHDVNVELIGTMATLPADMSPLQIGTSGHYQDISFQLVGRIKLAWDDGVWNEWFFITDTGQKGWLAEAQGTYGICFEMTPPLDPQTASYLKQYDWPIEKETERSSVKNRLSPKNVREILGSYLTINNQKLRVVDIKQAIYIGSEGELPFKAISDTRIITLDLLGENNSFATIEIRENTCPVYVGHYIEWNDMRCKNTRYLEGWS